MFVLFWPVQVNIYYEKIIIMVSFSTINNDNNVDLSWGLGVI